VRAKMVRIVAWDIAVKTLSFCMMDLPTFVMQPVSADALSNTHTPTNTPIQKGRLVYSEPIMWDVINVLQDTRICSHTTFQSFTKPVIPCTANAKWYHSKKEAYYCGKHYKKIDQEFPNELTKIESELVKNYTPHEILMKLVRKLDNYPDLCDVEYIILENQPSNNIYMKTMERALMMYFTIKTINNNKTKRIFLINAKNKTNVSKIPYDGHAFVSEKKDKYSQRKDASIFYCKYFINKFYSTQNAAKWINFMDEHKIKMDDLADSFMHCIVSIWQIHFELVYPQLDKFPDEKKYLLIQKIIDTGDHNISIYKDNNGDNTKKTLKPLGKLITELQEKWVWLPSS
jgi:hypothetical protein